VRAVGVCESQQAFQRLIARRFDPGRQGDGEAFGADAGALIFAVIDGVAVECEEVRLACTRQRDAQRGRFARRDVRSDRIIAARQIRDQVGDARRPLGLIAPLRSDGQRERGGALLRNARVIGADDEIDVRGELCGLAGARRWARAHLDGQQHFVRVAVIDETERHDRMRRRPANPAGLKSGRQRPGDVGGLARSAGIAPIGVPAVEDALAQHDGEAFSRRHRGARRMQRGLHASRAKQLSLGRRSQRGEQHGGESYEEAHRERHTVPTRPWPMRHKRKRPALSDEALASTDQADAQLLSGVAA
jgi:hypothetical protein